MSFPTVRPAAAPVLPFVFDTETAVSPKSVLAFGQAAGQQRAAATETELALIQSRAGIREDAVTSQFVALRTPIDISAHSPETMLQLLAMVRDSVWASDDANRDLRMQTFAAKSQANQARMEELSERLDSLKGKYDASLDAALAAGADAEEAVAAFKEAQAEVSRLVALLDAAAPGTPEHAALENELAAAQGHATQAGQRAEAAGAAFVAANAAAIAAGDAHNAVLAEIEDILGSMPGAIGLPINLSHEGKLTELMALVSEMMAESVMAGMNEDLALQQERLEAQRVENEKRAKEMEEQQRKNDAANKTMGSITKTLIYLGTAIALACATYTALTASVLTFGAAAGLVVAVAAAGLLLVAEVTKYDVVGEALAPVMENLFMPIIAFAMEQAPHIFGEEIGRYAGMLLGAALAIAAMVAIVVVTRQVGPVVSKLAAPILKEALGQIMPKVAVTAAKQLLKPMIRASARIAARQQKFVANLSEKTVERLAVASTRLGQAQVATMAGQAAFGVGRAAYQGSLELDMADRNVSFEEALLNSSLLRQMREVMYEKMQEQMGVIDELVAMIADSLTTSLAGKMSMMQYSRPNHV